MSEPEKRKPKEKSWRDAASDVFAWVFAGLFLLTLPLSFPALIVYKKVRGEKMRGKGAAFLTMLWMASMIVLSIVIAAYVKKGWSGLETLFYIALGGAVWALVVFVGMRIFVDVVAWGWKAWQWIKKRSNK